MDIASASDTAVRLPTIEVSPKATPDAGTPTAPSDDTKPDFWHRAFGKDGFSFSTLLDIVNPLQHIPIVSTIYQKLTGDVASPGANIIGGTLYGGVIGLVFASADTAIKSETGNDLGGHVFAMFDSKKSGDEPATAVAGTSGPTDPAAAATDANAVVDMASDIKNVAASTSTVADAQQATAAAPAPNAAPMAAPIAKPMTARPLAPIVATTKTATPTKAFTPFPFAMSNGNRHAAGNGIGGSFVPLETRASIAPAPFQVALPPSDSSLVGGTSKLAQKPTDVTVPDLQALTSNPAMMLKLQQDGLRKQAAKAPDAAPAAETAQPASVIAAPSASDSADTTGTTDNTSASNDNTDYASLMARNLARYMALQNKNAAPAKVNQNY